MGLFFKLRMKAMTLSNSWLALLGSFTLDAPRRAGPFRPFLDTLIWLRGLSREMEMWILWTIVIGFVAGVLAKFLTPGDTHEPQGFILTTLLGIAGAFVMTYLGQALGWYQEGQATGFIGATLGAILILLVWGFIAARRQTP